MHLTSYGAWQKVKRYTMVMFPWLFLTACATQAPPISPSQQELPVTNKPEVRTPTFTVATPKQIALRALIARQDRLYDIAAPLLVNNAELCRNNARNLLGFTAKTKYSYSAEFIDTATSAGLTDQLQVSGVLAGSGAARAGIQRNDRVTMIQDNPVPTGPDAERLTAMMLGTIINGRNSIKITVTRNGDNLTLDVPLTPACAFGIELGNTDNVNSYADGRRILVTAGMMDFTKNDDELAYVIAREMAHNTLTHPARQRITATLRGVVDNLIRLHPDSSLLSGNGGVKPYTQQMDVAADKLALYMVARAGYTIDHATVFWQRLATQYPATVTNGHTAIHPATAPRLAAIQKTISEIQAKQAQGAPLVP